MQGSQISGAMPPGGSMRWLNVGACGALALGLFLAAPALTGGDKAYALGQEVIDVMATGSITDDKAMAEFIADHPMDGIEALLEINVLDGDVITFWAMPPGIPPMTVANLDVDAATFWGAEDQNEVLIQSSFDQIPGVAAPLNFYAGIDRTALIIATETPEVRGKGGEMGWLTFGSDVYIKDGSITSELGGSGGGTHYLVNTGMGATLLIADSGMAPAHEIWTLADTGMTPTHTRVTDSGMQPTHQAV